MNFGQHPDNGHQPKAAIGSQPGHGVTIILIRIGNTFDSSLENIDRLAHYHFPTDILAQIFYSEKNVK
jgi:hypothetical protein